MKEVRCKKCDKKLAMLEGIAEIRCPRCKYINIINTEAQEAQT